MASRMLSGGTAPGPAPAPDPVPEPIPESAVPAPDASSEAPKIPAAPNVPAKPRVVLNVSLDSLRRIQILENTIASLQTQISAFQTSIAAAQSERAKLMQSMNLDPSNPLDDQVQVVLK